MAAPHRPRVDLTGTSYEVGFQHGSLLRKQIETQLAIYKTIFKLKASLEWSQVIEYANMFQPTIRRLAPDLYSEIEGIAAGVGGEVGLLDIIALNARSEIALGTFEDGCTSLAWSIKSEDASHRQFLGQNWDWTPAVGDNLAMASITKPGKPKIWMVIEVGTYTSKLALGSEKLGAHYIKPGIVGKIGFNDASVGVCLNAIRAPALKTDLLPIHLLLRIALECSSVGEAITTFEKLGGPASSQHILIADAISGASGLELSPNGSTYLKPDSQGVIIHTNHFIKNELVQKVPWLAGSAPRYARAKELCENLQKEVDTTRISPQMLRQRIFEDNRGDPEGICANNGSQFQTLFNIVMCFEKNKLPSAEVVFGRPGTEQASVAIHMPW